MGVGFAHWIFDVLIALQTDAVALRIALFYLLGGVKAPHTPSEFTLLGEPHFPVLKICHFAGQKR